MRLLPTVLCGATLLTACSGQDDHDHAQLKGGRQLYDYHCAPCHQISGEGAFLRGVPPVKFTTMTYQQLVDYIRGHGRAEGSQMPRFSTMPKAEAEAIAVYIRGQLNLR